MQGAAKPLSQGVTLEPQRRATRTALLEVTSGRPSRSNKSAESDPPKGTPSSAECVQGSVGSRNSAIHNAYRTSLRPSSMHKPRHPSLKVVTQVPLHGASGRRPRETTTKANQPEARRRGRTPQAETGPAAHALCPAPRRARRCKNPSSRTRRSRV